MLAYPLPLPICATAQKSRQRFRSSTKRIGFLSVRNAGYEAGKRIRTMAPDEKSYYQDDITIAKQ